MDAFTTDLRQMADISAVSKCDNYLGQFVPHDIGVYLAGGNEASATDAQNINTDENFASANGIKVVSGRDFRLNDTNRVLINETLMKRLGLNHQNAPGTKIYSQFGKSPVYVQEIVGVMKDFN